jgi:endonuclease YncB( thermonuclease family)
VIALLIAMTLAQPPGALMVERYEWHDADTATRAVVRLPYGVLIEATIRADDYDAAEIGSRTGSAVSEQEKAIGKQAVEELRRMSVGRTLYVVPSNGGRRDSFGRLLGRLVLVDGGRRETWLRDWAIANGYTRPKKGR